MQPLQKEGKFMYEHNVCVREMQNAMAQVVNEDLLDDIKQSGVYMFSLMADESTDVSTEKTLMLYVRYIKNGAPCVKFLDVTEVSGDECNAKSVCETILRIMENYRLNIQDMACITTDGASVMTGQRGGVTTLLKERNGQLLSIHCIAYRLALASGQAADKIPYLKKYQAVLNTIFKYFHYSPKHLAKLSKIQQVFDLSERKFRQTFHTRWLSFEGAVDAVIANYDALVCCLEMDVAEEDDPTARGLLSFVTEYKFLATSYMLSDILSHLCLMSKIFQKRDLDLGTFVLTTSSAIETFKTLRTTCGPNQKKFESQLPDDFETGFVFGSLKHRIKNTEIQCEQFAKVRSEYLDLQIHNLQRRFEDNNMIANFSVLHPLHMPDSEKLSAYGNLEIQQLGQFYNSHDHQSQYLSVDSVTLATEWPMFRQVMDRKYRGKTLVEMSTDFTSNLDFDMLFPNMKKLLKLAIVLPVSSADCERGFSRYNLIKTSLRNRLKIDSVNILLKLTVDTPSVANMGQFDFTRAFDLWVKQKNRRF